MNIEAIREFLGWCTIINIGVLAFSAIMVIALRGTISKIHQKMFGLDEAAVHQAYFRYLANYKVAIIVFNLTPYIALRIMS